MNRGSPKSVPVNCAYFTWRLSVRGGIYQASHRSRNTGVSVRQSLGVTTLEEAKRAVARLDQRLAAERGLCLPPADDGPIVAIDAGIERFLDAKRDLITAGQFRPESITKYRQQLSAFRAYAASKRIESWHEVTPAALDRYVVWLAASKHLGPKSANMYARVVHGVLRHLVNRERLLPRDLLFEFTERPFRSQPRYCFTDEQVEAMLATARSLPGHRWLYAALLTLARTGLRRGELRNLMWSDINDDFTLLIVRHDPESGRFTKSGESRPVPITPDLAEMLRELPRHPDGFVLRARLGGRLNTEQLRLKFQQLVRDPLAPRFPAKGPGACFGESTLHSFRHYAVDHARRIGIPEKIRHVIFGHKDEATHAIYEHVTEDEIAGLGPRLEGGREA